MPQNLNLSSCPSLLPGERVPQRRLRFTAKRILLPTSSVFSQDVFLRVNFQFGNVTSGGLFWHSGRFCRPLLYFTTGQSEAK